MEIPSYKASTACHFVGEVDETVAFRPALSIQTNRSVQQTEVVTSFRTSEQRAKQAMYSLLAVFST
jgi:hypothetical protein